MRLLLSVLYWSCEPKKCAVWPEQAARLIHPRKKLYLLLMYTRNEIGSQKTPHLQLKNTVSCHIHTPPLNGVGVVAAWPSGGANFYMKKYTTTMLTTNVKVCHCLTLGGLLPSLLLDSVVKKKRIQHSLPLCSIKIAHNSLPQTV